MVQETEPAAPEEKKLDLSRKIKQAARFAGILLFAAAILSIGIAKDWRLIHEDNGATFTTLALSHINLGYGKTKFHDFFYDPKSDEMRLYGHHPPAPAIILSVIFRLTGRDDPWIARSLAIVFHLASITLFILLLQLLVPDPWPWAGGLLMATLPMSAFFGRMYSYEPLGLFAVMIQLLGWMRFKITASYNHLTLLCFGVILGGFIDWAPLFFSLAIFFNESVNWVRTRNKTYLIAALVTGAAGLGIFLADLAHLRYAGGGSLETLSHVLTRNALVRQADFSALQWVLTQLEYFRRYFTHAGLISAALTAIALGRPQSRLGTALGLNQPASPLRPFLLICGLAGSGYVLSAPRWAKVHHFWQFYMIPFAIISLLLALRWIKREPGRKVLMAVFFAEIIASSAYTLYIRHTRVSAYAVEATRNFRLSYIPPSHAFVVANEIEKWAEIKKGAGGK